MNLQEPLDFVRKLSENNNREWFETNKHAYLSAKARFDAFTTELITETGKIDPLIGQLKASDCTFRIYRDVRFSKEKSPFKTNMGTYIARGGRKSIYAGYYFHLEHGGLSYAGGGLYMPGSDRLRMVRQEIYYNIKEFRSIIENKQFTAEFKSLDPMGDELKKAPQGFPPGWPDIKLLKFKHYVTGRYFSDEEVSSDGILKQVVRSFRTLQPLAAFLNRALEMPGL